MTHKLRMRPLTPAIVAVALLAFGTGSARADAGVGVVVTGEATMQPQLAAQLETWLRTHGHNLVSAPLPPEAINTLIDCFVMEDQSCARKVVEKRAKSTSVVFAQVSVTAGATALDRTVTLTAYWLDKGKEAIAERRSCERCTDTSLRSTADELMAALAGAGSNRGRIKVATTPAGARVVIDGMPMGTTPLDTSLSIGDHPVVIELAGHATERRSVSIKKAQTATIDVTLVEKRAPGWRRPVPLALLAGGAALVVVGGVMVLTDEDVTPTGPQQPKYRDTALGGVVFVATGAVAIGVGVALAMRAPKRRSTPAVGWAPGGAVVGWAGRF